MRWVDCGSVEGMSAEEIVMRKNRKSRSKRRNPLHRVHGTLVPSNSSGDSLISLGVGIGALALLAFVTR